MTEQRAVGRRTAVRTLGAATAAATGVPVAGVAASSSGESDPDTDSDLTGFYTGTVDRVVDGEHVVILVEADGSVVGQQIVPAAEYPTLEERDGVYLFILFGRVLAIWPAPDG